MFVCYVRVHVRYIHVIMYNTFTYRYMYYDFRIISHRELKMQRLANQRKLLDLAVDVPGYGKLAPDSTRHVPDLKSNFLAFRSGGIQLNLTPEHR